MHTLETFVKMLKETEKSVVCFGTGLMAEEALRYDVIKERVLCFLDNDVTKQGKKIILSNQEFAVYAPLDILKKADSQTVILLVSGHYMAMEKQLRELGLPDTVEIYAYPVMKVSYTVDSDEFFEQRILNECLKEYAIVLDQYHITGEERDRRLQEKKHYIVGDSKEDRPLVLPRIMIMPTTRCNMRCKGCSSLLPYFKTPQDVPIEQIIDDFELFFSGIDECMRITVGGEPFLYPHLQEILEYLLAQKKVLGIMLITNSTILPKPEVVELLRNPKILVEVSDYGHLEKMSRLINILEENKVNFLVLTEQTWTDMGGIECRNRSEDELRFQYLNCDQSRVIKGIHNGRFHTCARSARMFALGAYDSPKDYFDLREEGENMRTKIKEMYYSETADSCNYCDLGVLPAKVIEAGIQMNGQFKKSAYTIVKREEYEQLKKMAKMQE